VWGQQVLSHGLCDVEALQVGLAGQDTAVPAWSEGWAERRQACTAGVQSEGST
jgi:hypothetical protein